MATLLTQGRAYTGVDVNVMFQASSISGLEINPGNVALISVSEFADDKVVRFIGYRGGVAITNGPCQIAGTCIFIFMKNSPIFSWLKAVRGATGNRYPTFIDLPRVNIIMTMQNEYDSVILRSALYNVKFNSAGSVYAVDDNKLELTIGWQALGYVPMSETDEGSFTPYADGSVEAPSAGDAAPDPNSPTSVGAGQAPPSIQNAWQAQMLQRMATQGIKNGQ